ncbi:MAG: molecular chaperone DnaJ [Alphaproteobacteria bacterium]
MPASLILGLAAFVLVVLVLRWFLSTEAREVLRTARWTTIAILVVAALFLLVTGRLGWAFAAGAALLPWVVRLARLHAALRTLRLFLINVVGGGFYPTGGTGSGSRFGAPRGQASNGGASAVHSAFLRMTLDHDSGLMSGRVLAGRFVGQRLDDMSMADLMEFSRECLVDEESSRLLEAWLDHAHPEWRTPTADKADKTAYTPPPPPPPGGMSREEAYHILGLDPGAEPEAVRKAHRHLIGKVHPDHGGSSYLAAQINRAKDVLLGS